MTIEVELTIKCGKKEPKKYQLIQTADAKLNEKTGKTSLAHFQPAEGSKVVMPFSKLYIDTSELTKK